MKIKQHVVITKPDRFLQGDYDYCMTLFGSEVTLIDGWIDCDEIELDLDVDLAEMTVTVVTAIDKKIEQERDEFASKIWVLETRKQELLALTHENAS